MKKAPSAACFGGQRRNERREWPRCCSGRSPTIAISTSGTSRFRQQSARSAGHHRLGLAASTLASLADRSPAPRAWKSRTRGATRSIWSRSSRLLRASFGRRWPAASAGASERSRRLLRRIPRPTSRRCCRRCATARRRKNWPAVAYAAALGSRTSIRATSSATGTLRCTRSRSPTPSSRACAARRRPSFCAACFDAAASVYLDRFLNMPAARVPESDPRRSRRGCWTSCLRCSTASSRSTRRESSRRPTRAGGDQTLAGRTRRGAGPRGPQLPHDQWSRRRSGSMSCCRNDKPGTANRRRALPRGPRADSAHAGADVRDRRRLHRGEKLYEDAVD